MPVSNLSGEPTCHRDSLELGVTAFLANGPGCGTIAEMSSNRMPEHHRALRVPFVAGVLVTELVTEKQIAAHTQDLSTYGCFIETITPFPAETKVRLRISRGGQQLVAQGKVTYSRPTAGMGVVFVSFEQGSLAILDKWLEDLRKR